MAQFDVKHGLSQTLRALLEPSSKPVRQTAETTHQVPRKCKDACPQLDSMESTHPSSRHLERNRSMGALLGRAKWAVSLSLQCPVGFFDVLLSSLWWKGVKGIQQNSKVHFSHSLPCFSFLHLQVHCIDLLLFVCSCSVWAIVFPDAISAPFYWSWCSLPLASGRAKFRAARKTGAAALEVFSCRIIDAENEATC